MQSIPILTLPLTASATVRTERFVTYAGAECGAGVASAGVSAEAGVSGDVIPVVRIGTAVVAAGAAVTAGGLVETDAQGRAINRSAGVAVGRALQAATVAGQRIEVLLLPN
jgi:hypothetical protein